MSLFQVHTPDSAPEGSRDTLAQVQKKYGFQPNLFGVLAESPAAVQAYAAIGDALGQATLTPVEQQIVAVAISAENGCTYCVAAHSTVAGMVNAPADAVEATRNESPIADAKLEALRSFAVSLVRNRGWLDPAEVQTFLDAGYGRAAVLEVITYLALKTLSNYTNHLSETPLDAAFAPQRWEKGAVAV